MPDFMAESSIPSPRAKMGTMKSNIIIENPVQLDDLPETALFKLVEWIMDSEKQDHWNVVFVFVDDAYIIDLNKRFFNKSTPTDVISFDLSDPYDAHGEVYISVDTAKVNAAYFNASLENELYRLVAHGVYHLLGFEDGTPEEKQIMTALENKALEYIYSKLS